MNLTIKSFDAANSAKEYNAIFLKFESIAKSNPAEWLPYYYMSLVKSRMSMQKMSNADDLANQSILYIEKAKQIQINN